MTLEEAKTIASFPEHESYERLKMAQARLIKTLPQQNTQRSMDKLATRLQRLEDQLDAIAYKEEIQKL